MRCIFPVFLNPDHLLINYFQVQVSVMPLESADKCAKAIVDSACRGEKYLTEPSWTKVTILWKVFCPEIIDWWNRLLLMTRPGSSHRAVSRAETKAQDSCGFKTPGCILRVSKISLNPHKPRCSDLVHPLANKTRGMGEEN